MAIADRATSSANSTTQQTSLSWSHTVTSGSDRVLFVFISIDSSGGTGQTYNASATYNGVSMTRIANANDNQYGAAFVLVAPAEGTNTVQVSWTGSQYPSGVAISYTGVDQTTPNDTVTINTSSSATSFSNAISSATGDMVLAFYSVNNNTTPLTATGSGTARVETGSTPYTSAGVSDASGAASVTTGWSWPGSNRYSGVSFNINAAGSSAVTGSGAVTFGAMTGAGTGALALTGTGAATFGAMTAAGAGTLGISGSGTAVFGAMTVAGVGELGVTGTGTAAFADMSAAGTGVLALSGSGAATFGAMTVAGAGTALENVTGSGTAVFAAMGATGAGTVATPVTGSGAITFASMTTSGVGVAAGTITGSGAVLFGGMSAVGVGRISFEPTPTPVPPVPRRAALSAVPLPTSPFVYPLNGNLTPVGYQFLLALMRRTGGLAGAAAISPDVLLPFAAIGLGEDVTLTAIEGVPYLSAFAEPAVPVAPVVPNFQPFYVPTLQTPPRPDAVVLGASPATLRAGAKGHFLLTGGTVTSVTLSRDGVTFLATGLTAGFFPVDIADELLVTYAVAPTVTFLASSTYA